MDQSVYPRGWEQRMQDWDAIVIGSGMGGMTAAAYLAANGHRTLVLEQGDVLGGCTHVFRRKGYEFEVGVHYLGDCGRPEGNIPTMLRGVGVDKRIEFAEIDPDGFDVLTYPSVTFKVPRGWDNYQNRLLETFPDDQAALRRYLRIIRKLAGAVDRATTPASTRGLVTFLVRAGWAAPFAMVPLARLLDICGVGPAPRPVLCGQTPAYAAPADRAPAIVQAGYLENYVGGGAYFPIGGGQVLSATLAEVVRANNGDFRLNARAAKIVVESGKVSGVQLADGEVITAPVVVSNADLKRTYLELLDPSVVSPIKRKLVSSYSMAWPLFNTYLGLDIDLSETMTSSQIWKFGTDADFGPMRKAGDWKANGRNLDRWLAVSRENASAMIHIATNKDTMTALAPAGHSVVEAMTYLPPDHDLWGLGAGGPVHGESYRTNPDYQAVKDAVTEMLIDVVDQVIPNVRDHIVWQEAATPITQERYTRSTAGGSYGIEMNVRQVGPLRPGPKTDIRGLYLAGASTSWGPGVEGVMLSGVGAAGAVLGRDLFGEIRKGAVFGNADQLPERGDDWDPLAIATDATPRGQKARAGVRR
ncbi:phytoene desaturase family protein [Antrihabitans cavernicola]|uniref:NAD(P)/FAD-dependent oxidoreductase n=1 Tax=Antrihabitans cavernicola TaxID=2495913 RepID=A0A5A7SKP5_9NOCA|nr:NAD(P)/FAD-dependent oxidoreductase [Spelaeibacter cavernicola]KAA0024791.1 NAD(P)/FAD-dependent oxidoreductase [Spelaeibacter cavernicola]